MKTFENCCAQGDVYIKRIDKLPRGAAPVEQEKDGRYVLAHSETGHHHVMEAEHVTVHRLPDSIMDLFVTVKRPTTLTHLRPHDTHEPILFDKGVYHVRRQREYTLEGWRVAQD